MSREYRIEYSIQRAAGEMDTFEEIGFGSSGAWRDVDSALYAASTDIQRRSWETTGDMPDPSEVDAEEAPCPRCGGLNGQHGLVHTRYANGGGGNTACPNGDGAP